MKSSKQKKSALQYIGVQQGCVNQQSNVVSVKLSLLAEIIEEEPGCYLAVCPALDVYSQGDSIEEAEANIAEAVDMFLEACIKRKTLSEVLTDCGFYEIAKGAARNKTRKRKTPPMQNGDVLRQFTLPAELPLMAFNGATKAIPA